jgi:hypothetical protein
VFGTDGTDRAVAAAPADNLSAQREELGVGQRVLRPVHVPVQDLSVLDDVLTAQAHGHDVVERGRLRCEDPPRERTEVSLALQQFEDARGRDRRSGGRLRLGMYRRVGVTLDAAHLCHADRAPCRIAVIVFCTASIANTSHVGRHRLGRGLVGGWLRRTCHPTTML